MGNDVTGGFLYETSYAEGNATHAEKTQKECADALHVHVSTFRRLEKDPSQFTIEQAKSSANFWKLSSM